MHFPTATSQAPVQWSLPRINEGDIRKLENVLREMIPSISPQDPQFGDLMRRCNTLQATVNLLKLQIDDISAVWEQKKAQRAQINPQVFFTSDKPPSQSEQNYIATYLNFELDQCFENKDSPNLSDFVEQAVLKCRQMHDQMDPQGKNISFAYVLNSSQIRSKIEQRFGGAYFQAIYLVYTQPEIPAKQFSSVRPMSEMDLLSAIAHPQTPSSNGFSPMCTSVGSSNPVSITEEFSLGGNSTGMLPLLEERPIFEDPFSGQNFE
ncbi:MAG: hypothetical protein JSS32_00765 [Verrucomicrobia bacterium]|nr:hypothetical protein [Verrucomicrobiota bacterium]